MEKKPHFNLRMAWSCFVHAMILVWSINSLVTSSNNETDRLALLAFKDKVTEDPFRTLSSWNDSLHFCGWHGVTCSRRHPNRVRVLDLDSQNLEGTLSPHIGNLTFLEEIILTMNNFHGSIPQEIGGLFRLQRLALNNNSFNGEIPSNLTHCTNLRKITLTDNQLLGRIPVELSSLSKLTNLALGKNKLQGTIPSSFGNLSSLVVIDLGENRLGGSIPYDLCRIEGFIDFNLEGNNLTGMVPDCLYNQSHITGFAVAANQLHGDLPLDIGFTLPRIEGLYLGQNKFSGPIPVSLSNASSLEVITFEGNRFTGPIPRDLGMLQGLRILSLHTNQLGTTSGNDLDFINSLTNSSTLKYLWVSKNSLRGSIPNSITNLSTQLSYLSFRKNQIYGTIPSGFESLVSLSVMDLGSNYLMTGNIPTVLAMLPNMYGLYLNGNQFSGEIPEFLNCSTSLTTLELSENKLQGRIPPSLGNCQNLFLLDLSVNNLSGTIPKEVIGLSSLKLALDLSNNALSGSLPAAVGNLSDLTHLDISKNRLSGHIPNQLGTCLTLEYLNMKRNFFEGKIPEELSDLKGLKILDLSQNALSGPIPEYLENFTLLTYLNLSFNEFEGPVPKGGIFRNASAVSVVGNSKLCGDDLGLKLLPCHIQTIKKKNFPALKVVIPVVVASACLVLLACILYICYRRRMSNAKPSSSSLLSHQYTRISYAELLKATNSFSADNLIGVGSYGSVYRGILSQMNTEVAVKVLNLQRRGATRSFLSECNALKNIRHRNLLKIITSCSTVDFQGNDFKALVFEYLPNGSLEEWLHPKTNEERDLRNLNFLQRLSIAIDVASALDYLHHYCRPTIVHCDLKPSNVLLDEDMIAHVADFGLARIFSTDSSSFSLGQASSVAIKGTIGYLAPEYGMGGEVSMQGDVYSYGILLLEMFTGKRPTDGMFRDGLNLHNFGEVALPEKVVSIMDPRMFLEGNNEGTNIEKDSDLQIRMQECFVSALKLGVACSVESPVGRMNMGEVLSELYHIRDHHQGVTIHTN